MKEGKSNEHAPPRTRKLGKRNALELLQRHVALERLGDGASTLGGYIIAPEAASVRESEREREREREREKEEREREREKGERREREGREKGERRGQK